MADDLRSRTEPAPAVDPDLSAALESLWARARPRLLERVAELEAAAQAAREGRLNPQVLSEAARTAHQIAGAAGTYGYHRATDIARELESLFSGDATNSAVGTHAAERVDALRRALRAPSAPAATGGAATDQPVLLIVHADPGRIERLAAAAHRRGLAPLCVESMDQAPGVDQPLAAALIDLGIGNAEATAVLAQLSAVHPRAPSLVISQEDVFLDRVETARAGARGFLSAALDDDALLDAVTEALARKPRARQRVLAVDDDPVVLDLLHRLFSDTGLAVSTLEDPLQLWDALARTSPDLLLLDVDMPQVTGLELCRLLRADPRWAGLPVLVLTGSVEPGAVHEVFAAGADDYAPKPVVGAELVARVTNRLERVGLYRQLAESDVLTGLANRRKFAADFERLQFAADRYNQPLAFALLDLDRFKQVNDRYGHALGDVVLQRMAELLSQHFRGEDIVGRWGGEEIALGLYGMTRADGVARVAAALEAMREETFSAPGQPPLRVTFSAGVAQYGLDGQDLHSLYRAADEVLYRAKGLGRDRVLPVGWHDDGTGPVDVVIVEDDEMLSGLLGHALATRGLRHLSVADGRHAAAMLGAPGAPRHGVVLLDVDLPGLNGLEVLAELRRADVLSHTKVIMLTGQTGEKEVLAAFDGGAFDHVAKPFSVPILMQRIRRALATPA